MHRPSPSRQPQSLASRLLMPLVSAVALFGVSKARDLAAAGVIDVYHTGPGKRSILRGKGDTYRYLRSTRYSPAAVRRLGAERGVGRPPAVLAARRAKILARQEAA